MKRIAEIHAESSEDEYMSGDDQIGKDEVFYTEGTDALQQARISIA